MLTTILRLFQRGTLLSKAKKMGNLPQI